MDKRKQRIIFIAVAIFLILVEFYIGIFVHDDFVLEDSIVSYKCGEKFYGEYDDGIMWNDPEIAVAWPLEKIGGLEKVILADKDKNLQSFSEFLAKENGGF